MRLPNVIQSPLSLSLISGLLLCLAWPAIGGLWLLVFVVLVPMLQMENQLYLQRAQHKSLRIWPIAFLGFLLWNIGTTYFILYIREPDSTAMEEFIARLVGGGLTYLLNSAFMATVIWLFHLTRRRVGSAAGYFGLVVYFLSFEYLHMHWSINWPWLNLGNVFAEHPQVYQWYEYTGSPGGSLWVLVLNILIFKCIRCYSGEGQGHWRRWAIGAALMLAIPLVWSNWKYANYVEQGEAVEVVCVQPNLDPYETKFTTNPIDQLSRMIELADSADTDQTRFYVLPETALQEGARMSGPAADLRFSGLWEHKYDESRSVRMLKQFLRSRGNAASAAIVAGVSDRAYYTDRSSPTAREAIGLGVYYDNYNSTLLVTKTEDTEVYHKSKLVPGAESIPFVSVLRFLDDLALDLGGTSGSLGIQESASVFEFEGMKLSPTICYESVFGEYNTDFVERGSQAIFISTNDSWWQDSPGYKQLVAYARLRAVETRRGIARSANTGITCFIDQRGDITSQLPWWQEAALRDVVYFSDVRTVYSVHGDYISRLAAFLSVLLLLWTAVIHFKKGR
jgi:apolipoprotein N-acyltransferase